MVKVPSSLGDFIATKQNKSTRCNKEQKLGCHFKVTSAFPARLDLQRVSLLFFILVFYLELFTLESPHIRHAKVRKTHPAQEGEMLGENTLLCFPDHSKS